LILSIYYFSFITHAGQFPHHVARIFGLKMDYHIVLLIDGGIDRPDDLDHYPQAVDNG